MDTIQMQILIFENTLFKESRSHPFKPFVFFNTTKKLELRIHTLLLGKEQFGQKSLVIECPGTIFFLFSWKMRSLYN